MAYLYLACAFLLNAGGNIFLKLGAQRGFDFTKISPVPLITDNWQFLLGLIFFGLNVIFYFLALQRLPLSVAYPVMVVMSFVIINSFAFFVLREPVLPVQIFGYAIIVFGLFLVVRFA